MTDERANTQQALAIAAKGPTLVIAGPGTGKTYTTIQRVVHLIEKEGARPEEIMLVTYTVKASKELTTRLTNELSSRGIEVNLHDMYIGTFHHICRRILKEFCEYTSLAKNYLETDQFEQQYIIYNHLKEFDAIPGIETIVPRERDWGYGPLTISPWRRCGDICRLVSGILEECMDPEDMRRRMGGALGGKVEILARMVMKYNRICREENVMDFTHLQTETYQLLTTHPEVLRKLQSRIHYVMIDEYQDTNYIQVELIRLLGGEKGNVFVVGDDDQGIYRFRGASVGNILGFADTYEKSQKFRLGTNYRSHPGIVQFCMDWMRFPQTQPHLWEGEGKLYRYLKGKIVADKQEQGQSVLKITARSIAEWQERFCDFVEGLKKSGKISDYNQVAVLVNSVKSSNSRTLQMGLHRRGIPCYAPRAGMYFDRKEVKWLLGTLLLLFPGFADTMESRPDMAETGQVVEKYMESMGMAKIMLGWPAARPLKEWLEETRSIITSTGHLPRSLLGLVYQILALPPFAGILDKATDGNSNEVRNLSLFTRMVGRFGYFLSENHGHGRETLEDVPIFFGRYLRLWFEQGVNEYEDEERYAPSGAVSFLNIHQSKGLEYPVVIVASLDEKPRDDEKGNFLSEVVETVTGRQPYEPADRVRNLDFQRKYYTAFSRAESLLVLTTAYTKGAYPSPCFWEVLKVLPEYDDRRISLDGISFKPVAKNTFKPRFAFTTHVALYEECPMKYKWQRVYRFASIQAVSAMYGELVHETIEDVHRAVLRGEAKSLAPQVIYGWMMANYISLSESENAWLPKEKLENAFAEVMGYVHFREGKWEQILEAEFPLELVREDYILHGTIDLLQGDGDMVDVIDFKTGKKPAAGSRKMERYLSQLEIYAGLVEEKWGRKVGNLTLYFTGDKENPCVTFPMTTDRVRRRMEDFDKTVHRILDGDFSEKAKGEKGTLPEACRYCDWKGYCWKR